MHANKRIGVVVAIIGLAILLATLNDKWLYKMAYNSGLDMKIFSKVMTFIPGIGIGLLILGTLIYVLTTKKQSANNKN